MSRRDAEDTVPTAAARRTIPGQKRALERELAEVEELRRPE
jgi:hypothetical protein